MTSGDDYFLLGEELTKRVSRDTFTPELCLVERKLVREREKGRERGGEEVRNNKHTLDARVHPVCLDV